MKLYCRSTYTALLNYVAFGLPPGSFGEALLLGDSELAYKKAHRNLVPVAKGGKGVNECMFDEQMHIVEISEDIVENMLTLVEERFPPILRGSHKNIIAWENHKGFSGAPAESKVLFLLFTEQVFLRKIKQMIERSEKEIVKPHTPSI